MGLWKERKGEAWRTYSFQRKHFGTIQIFYLEDSVAGFISLGPYKILKKQQQYFILYERLLDSFLLPVLIFLYFVLMVKYNFSNQKACKIKLQQFNNNLLNC